MATATSTTTTASTAPHTADASGKKVRKPYTITKSRESWTEEEHDKFLEALQLFDRDWKKIEDFVGSKTVIQVQKNGTIAHVPPPHPKRKAIHPYPQNAPKNVLVPLAASMVYPSSMNILTPEYALWDDISLLINNATSKIKPPQDEFTNLHGSEGTSEDAEPKGMARISNNTVSCLGTLSRTVASSEITEPGKQAPLLHGLPDFAEVYNFIGSVFDPDTTGHVQKLKEIVD